MTNTAGVGLVQLTARWCLTVCVTLVCFRMASRVYLTPVYNCQNHELSERQSLTPTLIECVHNGEEVTHLNEWEQEAHSKVGQPVYGAGDHESGRSVGLFKQFPGQDEGDSTCERREDFVSYNKSLPANNRNNKSQSGKKCSLFASTTVQIQY